MVCVFSLFTLKSLGGKKEVASYGEKTGVFRIKDIQKNLETNMCSFVKREIIVSYF
jgi:hypothetical protein